MRVGHNDKGDEKINEIKIDNNDSKVVAARGAKRTELQAKRKAKRIICSEGMSGTTSNRRQTYDVEVYSRVSQSGTCDMCHHEMMQAPPYALLPWVRSKSPSSGDELSHNSIDGGKEGMIGSRVPDSVRMSSKSLIICRKSS